MNCPNCGKPIPDDSAFCGECGTSIQQPVAEAPVNEIPAEPVVNEASAADEAFTPIQLGEEAAPIEETPKKKGGFFNFFKKIGKGKLIISAIALVLVAVIAFNWFFIKGFFIKTFGSDKAYLKFTETHTVANYAAPMTNAYGTIYRALSFDMATDGEIEFVVGDKATDLAKDLLDLSDKDLEFFKNLKIEYKTSMKKGRSSATYVLKAGKKEIIELESMLDLAEDVTYLGLGELSENYLATEGLYEDSVGKSSYKKLVDIMSNKDLQKALPTEKELNKLTEKYVGIALNAVEEVEKDSEKVTVDEISQKLTTLEYTITEETLLEMAKAVLEKAKDDKDIKKYVKDVVKFANKNDLVDEDDLDADDAWDEVQEAMEDALDNLEDADASDDELCTIISYVNGKHEIVGRTLEVDGKEQVSYITVQKGKNFEYEMVAPSANVEIFGSGTKSGDKVTGVYEVRVSDKKYCEIELVKFDFGKLYSKGYINGTIRIKPASNLFEELGAPRALVALDPGLEFVFKTSEKKSEVAINLTGDDEVVFGISMNGKISGGKKVKLPKEKNTTDDAEDWVKDLDPDKIIDALEDAGAPDALLDIIENPKEVMGAFNSLTTLPGSAAVESFDDYKDYDYYEDEDYDYYDDEDYDYYDDEDYDYYDEEDYDYYDDEDYDW